MIRHLRLKMIIFIMLFVTAMLALFVAAVYLIPHYQNMRIARSLLSEIVESSSALDDRSSIPQREEQKDPSDPGANRPGAKPPADAGHNPSLGSTVFASSAITAIVTDPSGVIISKETFKNAEDSAYFAGMISRILAGRDKNFGLTDDHYYMYKKNPNSYYFAFLDSTALFQSSNQTLLYSLMVGMFIWLLFFLISIVTVQKLTSPIETAMEKQHTFIANAEHEMKTPVAVIVANADVLETEYGENRWVSYIRKEALELNTLIQDMLSLSRLDYVEKDSEFSDVDYSSLINDSLLPFEAVAFEKNIELESDIEQGIHIKGIESLLSQLVSILINNALKYADSPGKIKVSLHCVRNAGVLCVYNTGEGIAPSDLPHIFDRFYRSGKESERKIDGHGLGLSIAQDIVRTHKGKIKVVNDPGHSTEFQVCLRRL